MKKCKKIAALFLSCVMAFSVLSATGIEALATAKTGTFKSGGYNVTKYLSYNPYAATAYTKSTTTAEYLAVVLMGRMENNKGEFLELTMDDMYDYNVKHSGSAFISVKITSTDIFTYISSVHTAKFSGKAEATSTYTVYP